MLHSHPCGGQAALLVRQFELKLRAGYGHAGGALRPKLVQHDDWLHVEGRESCWDQRLGSAPELLMYSSAVERLKEIHKLPGSLFNALLVGRVPLL